MHDGSSSFKARAHEIASLIMHAYFGGHAADHGDFISNFSSLWKERRNLKICLGAEY